jgi:hypothetical protein
VEDSEIRQKLSDASRAAGNAIASLLTTVKNMGGRPNVKLLSLFLFHSCSTGRRGLYPSTKFP